MKNVSKTILALCLSTLLTNAFAQSAEEAAIKTVIEKETQAWFDRDAKAMKSYWADVPQVSKCVSLIGGMVVHSYGGKLSNADPLAGMSKEPIKGKIERTEWNFRVVGNAAYVTYTEADIPETGPKGHFYESRFMEKMDGAWKIVAVNAVAYKP